MVLVNNKIEAQIFFLVCLFVFSTFPGQPCAHHEENYCINATPGLCHCVDGRLVCRSINQVSHLYNNSPDDGHMAARNM